jgi:hypothetical protein
MGNYVPGTYLVSDPPVVSRANPSMGLETTNPATLKIFHTMLGTLAGVADIFLSWPNEQFVFYRIGKRDGFVLGPISLLPQVRDIQTAQGLLEAALNTLGVVTAWGVLHTSYSLYYASRYYQSEESSGGLDFPGEQNLRLLDFAYFAFTIGTSFAVSDVEVTDSKMRRSVLGHQIIAFFYNAAILSLTINLAVDL